MIKSKNVRHRNKILKIAFFSIALLIFLAPIGKALSNEENSSTHTSLETLNSQTQEQYFLLCNEILQKMGIPELQEKILKKSYDESNQKIQIFKNNALKAEPKPSEEALEILSQRFVNNWNAIYFQKMQFDVIKIKIASALMTTVSYQELLNLNNALQSTKTYALPTAQKETFIIVHKTAQDVAMQASVEANHDIVKMITGSISHQKR